MEWVDLRLQAWMDKGFARSFRPAQLKKPGGGSNYPRFAGPKPALVASQQDSKTARQRESQAAPLFFSLVLGRSIVLKRVELVKNDVIRRFCRTDEFSELALIFFFRPRRISIGRDINDAVE